MGKGDSFCLARVNLRGENKGAMLSSILVQPVITFLVGAVLVLICVILFLNFNVLPNQSADDLASYRAGMDKVVPSGLVAGGPGEKAALKRFTGFLKGLGNAKFVRENALQVYAADAYLDDTLVTHHGAAEIEAYFLKTSETMTSYQLDIDDVVRSKDDYYIRWTMKFAAPLVGGGKPVFSVGMSQIRFNREGKVEFHQDFWDAGKNFYGRLPVIGGAVGYVRKSLNAN